MRLFVNFITFSRLAISPLLLLLEPFGKEFLGIYIYCGFSDVIDGWLARKFCIQNQTGAALDSMADLVFFGINLLIWVPKVIFYHWIIWWIVMIFVIRGLSVIVGYSKFHMFIPFLHTNMNKLTGVILFLLPFRTLLPDVNLAVMLVCVFASIASLEELSIYLLSKQLDRDISSVFSINLTQI